jgi:hypothetical protein
MASTWIKQRNSPMITDAFNLDLCSVSPISSNAAGLPSRAQTYWDDEFFFFVNQHFAIPS